MEESIRVAIIGTGKRSFAFYRPVIKQLHGVQLVSVWGRRDSAQRLGESLDVPSYTDLDQLIRETSPQIGVVSVNSPVTESPIRASLEGDVHNSGLI